MSVVDQLRDTVPYMEQSSVCDALVRENLLEPAEQFLERTGKRIRKSVVDLVFAMAGGTGNVPACLGEAIEWLHAGSLVIDDIQDESPMRRGMPALHLQIGVPLALNAGNWMYFQALDQMFDRSLSRDVQNRLVRHVIRTALRCHRGQSLDLGVRVEQVDPSDIHSIVTEISRLKTGSLVSMSAMLGASAAGANRALREALSRFGMNVGIALQMRNDLEELRSMTCASNEFSTSRSEDLCNSRITWPWAWAYRVCSSEDFAALVRQLPVSDDDPEAVSQLATQLLLRSEGRGEASIQRRLERQFSQLANHGVKDGALLEMRRVLERISRPRNEYSRATDA